VVEVAAALPETKGVRLGGALYNGNHARLGEEVVRLGSAGLDFVHLDVFDGNFVPDMGFPPRTIADLRPLTTLPFEVHLGVDEPLRIIPVLVGAGVDLVLIHVESVAMPYEALHVARGHGSKVGLAISLGTPLNCLEPVIRLVDGVLLLSRVTGEGSLGSSFDALVFRRVRAVKEMVFAAEAQVDIQVAGGVRREHVGELVAAGATTLALGGGIYRARDMAQAVAEIRNVVVQAKQRR
jgi:ribulose-phosphate 3-epimerase